MIVIMLSVSFVTLLSIDAAANTTDDLMLSWKWSPGQDWRHGLRSFRRSMGGTRAWRGVAPTSGVAPRAGGGLWAGGTIVGLGRVQALFLLVGGTAQTVALEFDAVSIVDDAVQNGVAEGRVGNNVVPLRHGHLTCDQERSFVIAIVDDLEKVAGLVIRSAWGLVAESLRVLLQAAPRRLDAAAASCAARIAAT